MATIGFSGALLTVGSKTDGWVKTRHVVGKQYQSDDNDNLYLNWNTGHRVEIGSQGAAAGLKVFGDISVTQKASTSGTECGYDRARPPRA